MSSEILNGKAVLFEYAISKSLVAWKHASYFITYYVSLIFLSLNNLKSVISHFKSSIKHCVGM